MSWPTTKLGDVCDFVRGPFGGALKKECFVEDGYAVYEQQHAIYNQFSDIRYFIDQSKFNELKRFILSPGDLIMSCSGTMGKIAIVPDGVKTGIINQALLKLTPTEKIDINYLKYWLESESFQFTLNENTHGAAIKNVASVSVLKAIEIPLPPLAEQKRIAAILDKADAIRRKRQQAIQLADDFLRAVFLEMFGDPVTNAKGWEEAVLKDIADIRSGVTKGKKINPDDAVTLPYMRVANVQDGYLALDDIQEITVSRRDAEKCQLMIGDILLTEGGDPDKLGRGYVWGGEIDNCIHQNHIFSVRVKDQSKIRPAFLSAVISSQRGKQYFLKVGKQTTGIASINKTVLSEFLPFIPPVEVQDNYLEISKKARNLFLGWGNNCTYAFDALSQKAFAGQL